MFEKILINSPGIMLVSMTIMSALNILGAPLIIAQVFGVIMLAMIPLSVFAFAIGGESTQSKSPGEF